MSFHRLARAELRKAATLPATYAALAVAVAGSLAITLVNSISVRNALASGRADLVGYTSWVEAAFSALPLGTVGAVVLGVVAISSEYTSNSGDAGGGRQITSTLTACPRRLRLLLAKASVVVLLVVGSAVVSIPGSLVAAYAVVGTAGGPTAPPGQIAARAVGATVYWALTALIALAVTVLTRNGIAPLIVLIVDNSLVSFSLLLSYLTPLAHYLPDLAGIRLFGDNPVLADALAPLTGGLVMAAWTVGLLAVAAVVLHRRDA
ncbi:hypothetical protein [Micromonospora zhanjiangensis]|uniref:ABC-2 family transporter protein n=1 Tax=Micromonospora zhanjiangensis TaxID=1522057 RepID=A0ABV8KI89_9ACTN